MVFRIENTCFRLIKNFKNAFNINDFTNLYVIEVLDKYKYIVGDLSDGKLRLRGFDDENRNINDLDDYLKKSCVFEAPYFILIKIDIQAYESLKNKDLVVDESGIIHTYVLKKEAFDKENLNLESNEYETPNISINPDKLNELY